MMKFDEGGGRVDPSFEAADAMTERYWLVHPNGGRQLIDPGEFDLNRLVEQARRVGGRLVVESRVAGPGGNPLAAVDRPFEPPLSALSPMFQRRLARIHACQVDYAIDINPRPTQHVLGGYYRARRLVRVYAVDRDLGRRPLEELFDTFLHEVAHHLEYTEPDAFRGRACERVPGTMHSRLFWRILGELKGRWAEDQRPK